VKVRLNIAAHDTPKRPDQVVDLAGRGAANGIGDTNPIYANLVNGRVDGKKVYEVRPERVLGREPNLDVV
jgi:hypothetical protein